MNRIVTGVTSGEIVHGRFLVHVDDVRIVRRGGVLVRRRCRLVRCRGVLVRRRR